MADPILGRAYPALLAPGLRVVVDGLGAIVLDPRGDRLLVWPIPGSEPVNVATERARIDYADPHTRDRVCRALEAHYDLLPKCVPRHPSEVVDWAGNASVDAAWYALYDDDRAMALRAVADAVWGSATSEAAEPAWTTCSYAESACSGSAFPPEDVVCPKCDARCSGPCGGEAAPVRREYSRTSFDCRTCGGLVEGWSDGAVAKPGWRKILNIDGPNSICPDCGNEDLVDLREEYPDACVGPARPVREVP